MWTVPISPRQANHASKSLASALMTTVSTNRTPTPIVPDCPTLPVTVRGRPLSVFTVNSPQVLDLSSSVRRPTVASGAPAPWHSRASITVVLSGPDDFNKRFAPFVGPQAALDCYRVAKNQIRFGAFMLLFAAFAALAAMTRHGIVVIVGSLFLVPAGLFAANRFRLRHKYFQHASSTLGVRVSWRNPVPLTIDNYHRWCQKHGAVPLS